MYGPGVVTNCAITPFLDRRLGCVLEFLKFVTHGRFESCSGGNYSRCAHLFHDWPLNLLMTLWDSGETHLDDIIFAFILSR